MKVINKDSGYSIKKVIRGASIYSLGDVLVKASGFFLIPIYTRILTPTDYGIVGYLQVFSQVLVVVLGFGFYGAQTRYYYENREDRIALGRFMFTINITQTALFLLLFVPILIFGFIGKWTIGSENIPFHPFMSITLVSVLLSVLNRNMTTFLQMRQQFSKATFVKILNFLLTTLFTIYLVIWLKKGALGRVLGNVYGLVGIFLITYWIYAKKFIPKFSKDALKYAIGFGLPIVIHLLMGTIHNTIDRLMLEHYIPFSQLGIYTLGMSVAMVLQMFITAFNQAYQPSFYQLMDSGNNDIENKLIDTFKIWLLLITTATCIGILTSGPFLTFFAGKQFVEVRKIFPYLLVAFYAGSFYFFFSTPIFYFKKTKYLPIITGTSALINISLNFILIPKYGIYGASIATIISHVWISALGYIIGNKLFRIQWPFKEILTSIIFVSVTLYIISI